jgi:DNA modification methylase
VIQLHCGNSLDVIATLGDDSVDSIVTDPPYGLSFMGRKWDYDVPSVDIWQECFRVLKPGGHLLAFAGTRTQHRMAVNIEDAGFEIRDMIAWVYGSGFPKGKSCLKPALEPITMARKRAKKVQPLNIDGCRVPTDEKLARPFNEANNEVLGKFSRFGNPNEPNGGRWPANLIHDGSDEVTQLFPHTTSGKPSGVRGASKHNVAYADVAVGSELTGFGDSGSAARFFQQCKGDYDGVWQDLNLPPEPASTADSCLSQQRQAVASALVLAVSSVLPGGMQLSVSMEPSTNATGIELKTLEESVTQAILNIAPRFWQESKHERLSLTISPVSVVVQKEPTGTTTITASHWKSDGSAEPVTYNITPNNLELGEKDSVARFKYCAKANKKDRSEGNTHPTVKPTDLMAYLVRLITPPGGVVLDPFMGSGSTGKAAVREGFDFIGIEREEEYVAIASKRLQVIQRSILASRSADQNG